MKWKAELSFCAIAIALIADAAAQSNSQLTETNRSGTSPSIKGTIGIVDRFSTNWIFNVLLPDGSVTNITVYGVTYHPTNTLVEWIRADGTRTNFPIGPVPRPTPPRFPQIINSPAKFQPVGDYWLPREIQKLFNKDIEKSEQRRSEVR
jgi:hypothetical protein